MTTGPEQDARDRGSSGSALVTGVLIGILCLIWSSTWLVIKGGLTALPPFTSAGARFLAAAAVMTGAAAMFARREGGKRPPVSLTLVTGVTNFALSYSCVYWSETRLPSGITSVLWSVFPMLMAIAGHLFLAGERLEARQWLGFIVGLLGVALLFVTDLASLDPRAIPAALILLASPVCSTIGTTILKRQGAGVSSLLLNRNAMWIGGALLSLAAWVFERDAGARWTGAAVLSVLYLAVIGTALAFGLYFWLLRHTPAHRLSLISYVTPAIALYLGWAFGEERVTGATLGGSFLILCGVALVVWGKKEAGAS